MTITKNGRDSLSAEERDRFQQRDRRVIAAGDLSDAEIALIAEAEVPFEYAHLDDELADSRR